MQIDLYHPCMQHAQAHLERAPHTRARSATQAFSEETMFD
jgi:hypothetical protein